MGDITISEFPHQPLMPREVLELYPPLFLRGDLLSAGVSGRVSRFSEQYVLGWQGEKTGSLRRLPNDLWARVKAGPRIAIRADNERVSQRRIITEGD